MTSDPGEMSLLFNHVVTNFGGGKEHSQGVSRTREDGVGELGQRVDGLPGGDGVPTIQEMTSFAGDLPLRVPSL